MQIDVKRNVTSLCKQVFVLTDTPSVLAQFIQDRYGVNSVQDVENLLSKRRSVPIRLMKGCQGGA